MANTYHQIYIKLFQPLSELIRTGFFTTKPTGSGTGLGLSLSYDIIKAHGGELEFSECPSVRKLNLNNGSYLHIENYPKNQCKINRHGMISNCFKAIYSTNLILLEYRDSSVKQ